MSSPRASRRLRACLLGCALLAVAPPAADATMTWDSGGHNFGTQVVGTSSAPKTFTLTAICDAGAVAVCNSPAAGLHTFGTPTVSGEGFALGTPNSCSTGFMFTLTFPGVTACSSTVVFTPATLGPKTGSLSTAAGPDIPLSGTGVAQGTGTPQGGASLGGVRGRAKKCKAKKKRKKRKVAAPAGRKKPKCKTRKKRKRRK